MYLNNHGFCSQKFQKYLRYEANFFFFLKCSKFNVDSRKVMKLLKMYLISKIFVFELATVNSTYYYENSNITLHPLMIKLLNARKL